MHKAEFALVNKEATLYALLFYVGSTYLYCRREEFGK